jgi:hypothetical protein
MDNLLTVTLEAHNIELNHHRRYQITVGRDLLDDWTVWSYAWASIGPRYCRSAFGFQRVSGKRCCRPVPI